MLENRVCCFKKGKVWLNLLLIAYGPIRSSSFSTSSLAQIILERGDAKNTFSLVDDENENTISDLRNRESAKETGERMNV